MGELVLLVVAAAWAAVLIPPLLRSRMENRPNSSVTDFRRQLNKLQSTVPTRAAGPMRGYARPLAPSPLQRPAAAGRPGAAQVAARRAHGGRATATAVREAPRRRVHGDPSGAQPRPRAGQPAPRRQPSGRQMSGRQMSGADEVRRRRSNVLFMLVVATGATLFLAATTQATAMVYLFALSFLALCAYAYLLAQARQRENQGWPSDWMER